MTSGLSLVSPHQPPLSSVAQNSPLDTSTDGDTKKNLQVSIYMSDLDSEQFKIFSSNFRLLDLKIVRRVHIALNILVV